MNNNATCPDANGLRPFTLEHLNAAMLSGKEKMLVYYIDAAIGIYCNLRGRSVGPRPARMSEYSGDYGDAYYISFNAVYEVWLRIGSSFDPCKGDFRNYFNTAVRNKIIDIRKSGGRTDRLSQTAEEKSKDDAYDKLSRVDADGYRSEPGSEPDNVDPEKDEKIRQFMSDELDALIKYLDGLPEKERTVFLASDFGRAFSSSPDNSGRDYAEALAEKYHTSAGFIRKLASQEKKKALEAVQKQGFNKQAFTSIEFIQDKPRYAEAYDTVIEATEKLTPFEQFLLLKHIEDMKEEHSPSRIRHKFSDHMEIIHKDLLTDKEQGLVDEVLGFMFTESICFRDYRDDLVIEISPEEPPQRNRLIERNELEEKLEETIQAKDRIMGKHLEVLGQLDVCAFEFEKDEIRRQVGTLQARLGILGEMIRALRKLLKDDTGSIIELSMDVLGEFVSDPNPKVILYLGGYGRDDAERYESIIPTLVHELFHAVNFFEGGGCRTLRELDEPMVEFAAGVFLDAISKVKAGFDVIYEKHRAAVADKAKGIGEIACYGFGRYLMDNVEAQSSFSKKAWIEGYAKISASVNDNDSDAYCIPEYLYPCYPVGQEQRVMQRFENVIFRNSSNASHDAEGPETRRRLKVIRKDGSVLQMDTDEATFVLAILEAGITRVHALKLPAHERYLVQDRYEAGKSKLAAVQYYEPITGLYIQQSFAPERRKRYLEYISETLGLGWTVELV